MLLIVDYSKAREFDILDWFQHFRREGEDLVAPLIGEKAPFVWEDHFWLLLVNAGRPLAAVRKYIKMNPARKMWKRLNPDRFVRRSGLKHAVLDPSLSWTAIGDLTLLANPFMFPVRLTRKMTVEQHLPEIEQKLAGLMGMPVSTFRLLVNGNEILTKLCNAVMDEDVFRHYLGLRSRVV